MYTMNMQREKQRRLKQVIVAASTVKDWDGARREWELSSVFIEQNSKCACGHTIAENCVIRNVTNDAVLIVGNECIKHFECSRLNLDDTVFEGLRQIVCGGKANNALLDLCIRLRVLSALQVELYKSISRKRKPTEKQLGARIRMNKFILSQLGAKVPRSDCVGLGSCWVSLKEIPGENVDYFYKKTETWRPILVVLFRAR